MMIFKPSELAKDERFVFDVYEPRIASKYGASEYALEKWIAQRKGIIMNDWQLIAQAIDNASNQRVIVEFVK